MDCVFCKIISKEIPADIVYEDDHTIAFLDIKPVHAGHTLVLPKTHSNNVFDIESNDFAYVAETARKVARVIDEVIAPSGLNIIMNNKPAGGQVIFHSHAHIIPRYEGDNFFHPPPVHTYKKEEAKTLATKMKAAF